MRIKQYSNRLYLYFACFTGVAALIFYVGLYTIPKFAYLVNSDAFMKATGYFELTVLFLLSLFYIIKRKFAFIFSVLQFNLIHAVLGIVFLLVNSLHITKQPAGYLFFLYIIINLNVIVGASLLFFKYKIKPSIVNMLLHLHICLSLITLSIVFTHIYYIYTYTTHR